jgi:hypothetical protein
MLRRSYRLGIFYVMDSKALARRRTVLLLLLPSFLLQPLSLYAFTGTEGASFLEIPVGARPAAMGSAYSALAEDAYAPTWNPAGLGFLDSAQMAGMHMAYLQSTSYEYGSFVYPLGASRGIGFAVQYFQPGTIAGLDANGNSIGDFNGYYANYTIAFGQSFGSTLGVGFSGNMIQTQIDDVSGQAFAGSGGLLFRPNSQWRVAAVVANAGQKLTLLNTGDSLPLVYRIGAAYHPRPSWTLALEGARQVDGLASAHAGVEYETPFGFSFRTGYDTESTRQLSATAGVSLGVSMLLWNQDFSYTWLPMGDLGSSQLFSLVWRFGRSKQKEEDSHQMQRPPKEEDMDLNLDNYR